MRPFLWAASLSMLASSAFGEELPCSGKFTGMGCFDAAPFSGPAEPSPFRWLGRGTVLDFGQVAASTVVRYADSPADLLAPSADPRGRLIPVVRHSTRVDMRLAVGLGRGIDLTLIQPIGVSQSGAGPDALITQSPPTLESVGFADTRLSMRTKLPVGDEHFSWSMRLELTLPTGAERAYLGERDKTEAVALNAHWSAGAFAVAGDLGVRFARPTRFGDVTLGTHAFLGLGLDFSPLREDRLHITLEGLVRPQLISGWSIPRPHDESTTTNHAAPADWVMPTEWLLGLSSRPFQPDLWFSLGAGTALPLSHRESTSDRVDAWFIAPSSPRLQLLGAVSVRR